MNDIVVNYLGAQRLYELYMKNDQGRDTSCLIALKTMCFLNWV